MSWLVIRWDGKKWKRHTKVESSFVEHMEDFNALRDTAHMHEPPINPLIYKSIHTCWLSDIKDWENPFDEHKHLHSPEEIALTPNDARELRHFKKYLVARQRYGDAVLLKRKFWRKYLGVDDGKEEGT